MGGVATAGEDALLRVDGLSTVIGNVRRPQTILEDVSFAVAPGEVLGVVGESGSGKSMLALTLMNLLPRPIRRTAGRIALGGTELTGLSDRAWRDYRGRDMAMIFQEPMTSLNPVMRIGRQIMEVLVRRRGMSGRAAEKEAIRLLERVEISSPRERLRAYPHELSGGMRQRAMIAIALAANARLLIADEPTTALDVTIQAQILDLLRQLQAEMGMALILITHDLGVVAEMAHRVMVLYAGRVAELAPVEDIFYQPRHPYTQALLDSIPSVEARRERLATIEGSVPVAGAMPPGCRFAPRCPLARAPCTAAPPPVMPVGEGHGVACIAPFDYAPANELARRGAA
ncbi:MAG: ABC transporter ATP-binding protein [Azospirillaceae bacterium]